MLRDISVSASTGCGEAPQVAEGETHQGISWDMTLICLILTCGETATFKKEQGLRSISCTATLASTLVYKIWLERAAVTDTGRLGSTATQRILMHAEILFLLEEMLVHMYSHFPRRTLRITCEVQVMAAALVVADDAVHVFGERELE